MCWALLVVRCIPRFAVISSHHIGWVQVDLAHGLNFKITCLHLRAYHRIDRGWKLDLSQWILFIKEESLRLKRRLGNDMNLTSLSCIAGWFFVLRSCQVQAIFKSRPRLFKFLFLLIVEYSIDMSCDVVDFGTCWCLIHCRTNIRRWPKFHGWCHNIRRASLKQTWICNSLLYDSRFSLS